jgi:hypothetical protein
VDWLNIQALVSKKYVCGYCGNSVASERGWCARIAPHALEIVGHIYVCHHCTKPTFFYVDKSQTPGVVFGNSVNDVSDQMVAQLYEEARKTTGSGAYTAAVLCCRKLLMHIAVSQKAPIGKNFLEYVEYLANNNFIPPGAKGWVDHIRRKGNEANHEIAVMSQEDAEDLLSFIEMLLKQIFEFPAKINKKITQT